MNNYAKSAARLILSLVFLNTLYACDSGNTGNATNVARTEMPSVLQKLTLGAGTLTAFVTIDGGSRIAMTIDPAGLGGLGSASATIPGLTLDVHTVAITYEFNDGVSTLVVATASNTVDLAGGSGSISFAAADYDLALHDEDGDGYSNAAELAAGTDPRVIDAPPVTACVLGTSTLDNCTL